MNIFFLWLVFEKSIIQSQSILLSIHFGNLIVFAALVMECLKININVVVLFNLFENV